MDQAKLTPQQLRERADRCRNLAEKDGHVQRATTLEQLAAEYDQRADAEEGRGEPSGGHLLERLKPKGVRF